MKDGVRITGSWGRGALLLPEPASFPSAAGRDGLGDVHPPSSSLPIIFQIKVLTQTESSKNRVSSQSSEVKMSVLEENHTLAPEAERGRAGRGRWC